MEKRARVNLSSGKLWRLLIVNIEEAAYKRGYRVTEDGIFINPKGNPIGTNDKWYNCTSIRIKGKLKKIKAHRLQAFQK